MKTERKTTLPESLLAPLSELLAKDAALGEKVLYALEKTLLQKDEEIAAQGQEITLQGQEIVAIKQDVMHKAALIDRLEQINKELEEKIKLLQRARFGKSTDKVKSKQVNDLAQEDLSADIAALQDEAERLMKKQETQDESKTKSARKKPVRKPLPENLERITEELDLDSTQCPECSGDLRFLKDEVSEKIEIIPAKIVVLRTVRKQYSCFCCNTVLSKPVPPAIIDKGQPSNGLLAHITVGKYIDHLPLYRQKAIFERYGIEIPYSTMAEWIGIIGERLAPLAQRLQDKLLNHTALHADETPITILGGHKAVAACKGYVWTYASMAECAEPIVVYECQTGRGSEYPVRFLESYQGALVVDGYTGYAPLFALGKTTEVACMAHIRRKFVEVYETGSDPVALQVIETIKPLYTLERLIKKRPPRWKQKWRKRYARPKMEELDTLLRSIHAAYPPGSAMYKAAKYAIGRWTAMKVYLDNGVLPIDNNHVERCIRPVALGRKNWLFAGSAQAGQRAAVIMSMLQTAKLNGLCPLRWLQEVLTRLPAWPNSRIDELLPLKNHFTFPSEQ